MTQPNEFKHCGKKDCIACNMAQYVKKLKAEGVDMSTFAFKSFGIEMLEPEGTPAPTFLEKALDHIKDRAATYDQPEGERSMGATVEAFNAITGHDLQESEGWLLLQILKDVRLFTRAKFHQDSAEDAVAYAALKAEAKSKGL